jgi:hypothetical protein
LRVQNGYAAQRAGKKATDMARIEQASTVERSGSKRLRDLHSGAGIHETIISRSMLHPIIIGRAGHG